MKISCGTDIIENKRIQKAVERSERFLVKNFTKAEIEYCTAKGSGMVQSLAARFAAKEAVAKALGTGFSGSVTPASIEILNDHTGKPYVELDESLKKEFSDIDEISISLSHSDLYSTAYAVITYK